MNIKVSSGELLKLCNICMTAIPSKAVMVILKDFLFEVIGDELFITASDLEFTIRGKIQVIATQDGRFAIPAEALVGTLRELPEQPIEIEFNEDNLAIEIRSSTGFYRTGSNSVSEYPQLPVFEEDNQVIIDSARLLKALNTCSFATSTDEMKTNMMGINMSVNPDSLVFVATNSHKLVKYTLYSENDNQDASMILPKKIISILKAMCNEYLPITILYAKNQVKFAYKDFEITCKLINLIYPNYNSVIPVNNDKEIIVDRQTMLHALRRLIVFGNKTTFQTNVNVEDNTMTMDTLDAEFSNEAQETIVCQYEGERLELCYNARYLIESISNLDAQEIKFLISQAGKAALLLPKEDEVGENILMIVMPVMKWRPYDE